MALTPDQRHLYARHLLLAELGEAGQERLCAGRFSIPPEAEPRAAAIAREYLLRAGVTESSDGVRVPLPDAEIIRCRAGEPELEEAAATLAGSLGAVETIKAIAGVGRGAAGAPADRHPPERR